MGPLSARPSAQSWPPGAAGGAPNVNVGSDVTQLVMPSEPETTVLLLLLFFFFKTTSFLGVVFKLIFFLQKGILVT
jgi:hypothetical protein